MLGSELMMSGHLEPGVGHYLQIGPALLRQLPARGNPVPGTERHLPPVQGDRERSLPIFLTYPWNGRPAHAQAPAWPEPAADPAGDQIAAEPVERVTDDGQFEELGLGVEGLGG